MRIGILQPYLLPYIGYFQLIACVDRLVVYDDVKYTKKGWINRNRFQSDGVERWFHVPLSRASDHLDIKERRISPTYDPKSTLNKLKNAYSKAQFFDSVIGPTRDVFHYDDYNLFSFLLNSIKTVNNYLGIRTSILVSSEVMPRNGLRGRDRVVAICKELGADEYVNPQNGRALYYAEDFAKEGLDLLFLTSNLRPYAQAGNTFQPGLSILDVMMLNPVTKIQEMLKHDFILLP